MSPDRDSIFDINDGTAAPPQRPAHAVSERAFSDSLLVRAVYGSYTWFVLLAIVIPMCLLLTVTPRLRQRRRIAHYAARLFFRAIGSPVGIEGPAIDLHYPCVVVANHASYLDGIILTAALPAGFTYLIKREMASIPIAGYVLRRLGSAFVDREDVLDRKRMAHALVGLARRGDALGFFPEGTFDASPGLKPFHLGAFSAAARAKLPVVPIVIHGSRRKLPSKRLLAAPGPLRVRICKPLDVARTAARDLMQAARNAMLEHLDEPDLAAAAQRTAAESTPDPHGASGTQPE
jgi:1-acyl-sn-glycerol-3-phosphate acyltransferase